MDGMVKQILAKPIQLADQVTKAAHKARCCKQECGELKSKTEKLASRLRQAARESSDLYERPTRWIIEETELVFHTALSLVLRCGTNNIIFKQVFPIILVSKFPKVSTQLDHSLANVSWLLNISAPADNRGGEFLHLPPLAARNPILFDIWEKIAILYTGSLKDRSEVTAYFIDASFIDNNDSYCKLFVEEGGVSPLLKLLKDGKMEEQENAARAIGFLGCHPESVKHMMDVGTCSIFANILKEGPMEVQALVAWAVSKLAENYPKCQDIFAQHNIIRLLADHLDFVTLQHRLVSSISELRMNLRMKEMASLALWFLVKGNSSICRTIVESNALSCFAVLLENGPEDAQYNSAMAVMEITAVAEKEADLRESAFHPNSSSYKAIVDQMLKMIKKANPELVIPCIKTIGNLAKAATNTRMIRPLMTLLLGSRRYRRLTRETLIALTKYVCTENNLHMDHSNAIINAGGAVECLILFVYSGNQSLEVPALVLLSYLVLHIPHRDELAETHVLRVLEWAYEMSITRDEVVGELLLESTSRLKLYLSRILRGLDGSLISLEDT